ncbi:phage virion morphogenesis protein [Undibacterium sp. SXout7W]|uniref:phage virion morphogenesis protein n=1 Tax=Undibacterium sp. SXout7W TaxID=3413049 RepID=UPI003BF320E1
MPDDLTQLESWAGALLAKLDPAARRKLTLQLAQELRRNQQQRVKAQQNPDGTPYAPRKQRKNLRGKQGRIKKQKASMFNKLRTNTHLKAKADGNGLEVGFYGRVARIARVHQYGLRDKISAGGGEVLYDRRELIGYSETATNIAYSHIAGTFTP